MQPDMRTLITLCEAVAPPSDQDVRAFAKGVQDELGLESFDVFPSSGGLHLNMLAVGSSNRKQGVGSAAMTRLCHYADEHGLRITLTPGSRDKRWGTTSRSRLVAFYKRFGFVENKGRNKDFAINTDQMYRMPK